MSFTELLQLLLTLGDQAWDLYKRIKDDIKDDGTIDEDVIDYEKGKLNDPLEDTLNDG